MKRNVLKIAAMVSTVAGCLQAAASTNVVVMLGDSTTQCIYNKPGFKLTELVQGYLTRKQEPARVVNSGVGGDTAKGALNRLQKDVLAHQPDVVTISFGLNDTGNLTPAEYRQSMESIIQNIQQNSQAKILLITSTPFNNARHIWKDLPQAKGDLDGYLNANYCATVLELAKKHNLALCDLHEHWAAKFKQNNKLVDELILPDGVHHTDEGTQDAAKYIAPAIIKLLATEAPTVPVK